MNTIVMPAPQAEPVLLSLLTPRQLEVLQWVEEGKSNWEIGQILGCGEETVKKHLQRVYRKLRVENRMAAANCLRRNLAVQ